MPTHPPLLLSSAVLVMANLVPLGGALLGWWSTYELLLLFWAENVVIGVLNVGRMIAVMIGQREWGMPLLIAFFAVHYGTFTYGHGLFLIGILGPAEANTMEDGIALLLAPDGLLLPLVLLFASHGFSFVVNFLGSGEWRQANGAKMMIQPYGRVVVLHLVIIAGGALVLALGAPIAALALLVVLKTVADLAAHRREHAGGAATS
jgi:hypothetical protein